MGTTSDEEGESSTQPRELETSDERPLKKARYIWQIKGKYHLKKPDEENKDTLKVTSENSPIEKNDELASQPPDLDTPHIEQVNETLPSPSSPASLEKTTDQESRVSTPCTSQEIYQLADAFSHWELKKWQDRQVARSYLDNTINRVLDVMGFVPLPFDADDISDEEFLMQNHGNDDDVEDEAVLMAIHSHGLQRSEHDGQDSQVPSELFCDSNQIPIVPCKCTQQASGSIETQTFDPFHQRPVLFHPPELDHLSQTIASFLDHGVPVLPGSKSNDAMTSPIESHPVFDISQSQLEDLRKETLKEVPSSNLFESESSLCTQVRPPTSIGFVNHSESLTNRPTDNRTSPSLEHNDFLDQAVGVAIQKKGLSTLSCLEFG